MRQNVITLLILIAGLAAVAAMKPACAEDETVTTDTARIEDSATTPSATSQEDAVTLSTPDTLNYESFAIVTERNIFDPDRSPARPRRSYEEEEHESERPAPEDWVTLLGAMVTPDWSVAIFNGSSGEFSRTCRTGDSIAGLRVDRIDTETITLTGDDGSTLSLPVGAHLRRSPGQPWSVSTEPVTQSFGAVRPDVSPPPPEQSSSPPGQATPAPPSNGGADDILKRMLERRQQEINK